MTADLYEYRATVRLNNTAVALLQRRCYCQAMRTFCDAFAVVKAVSARPRNREETKKNVDWIQEKLHNADQRLSSPDPSSVDLDGIFSLQVISDRTNPVLASSSSVFPTCSSGCQNPHNSNGVAHLICIETVDFELTDKTDITVDSAIILYNYGIAYRCLASLTTSLPYAPNVNQGAFHLMNLAYETALTSHRIQQYPDTSVPFQRVMLLGQLALQHLIDLCAPPTGTTNPQLQNYASRLQGLQQSLLTIPNIPRSERTAPAA